jgi:hypothetical protein
LLLALLRHLTGAYNFVRYLTPVTCSGDLLLNDVQIHPLAYLSQANTVVMPQNRETGVDIRCKVFAFGWVVLNVNDNSTRRGSFGPRRLRYLGWDFGLGFQNA